MKWKKQEGGILCAFLAPLSVSVVEPVIFSVVKLLLEKESWEQNENIIIIRTIVF